MSKIVNTNLSVLGNLTVTPSNATGDFLTLDGTNVVRKRTASEVSNEVDKNYVHNQGAANTIWSINHNLNKYPSVMVVDSAGSVVVGKIEYVDTNNLTVTFNAAFSGDAYMN